MEDPYPELDIYIGLKIKRRSSLVTICTRLGAHHTTNSRKLSLNFLDLLKLNKAVDYLENILHSRRHID